LGPGPGLRRGGALARSLARGSAAAHRYSRPLARRASGPAYLGTPRPHPPSPPLSRASTPVYWHIPAARVDPGRPSRAHNPSGCASAAANPPRTPLVPNQIRKLNSYSLVGLFQQGRDKAVELVRPMGGKCCGGGGEWGPGRPAPLGGIERSGPAGTRPARFTAPDKRQAMRCPRPENRNPNMTAPSGQRWVRRGATWLPRSGPGAPTICRGGPHHQGVCDEASLPACIED
jgi:hypothetical protein